MPLGLHRCSRMPARWLAAWLALASATVHLTAHADAPPDEAAMRQAEALATEAKVFFKAKLHEKAALRFMEAYAISRRPSLMFNAARAYEEAGALREAHALFVEYRKLPDVNDAGRQDADARIARLEADMRATDERAKTTATPKVESKVVVKVEPKIARPVEPQMPLHVDGRVPPPKSAPSLPIAKLAGAGGLLAFSLTAYLVARHDADLARATVVRDSADVEVYLGHASDAQTWRYVAVGSLAGGLALGGWAAYDVWRGGATAEPRPSWRLVPDRGGGQLVWTAGF